MEQPKYKFNAKGSTYTFTDLNGAQSEPFALAYPYKDGFAKVRVTMNSPEQYRDLLGRITDMPTQSGKQFYEYFVGSRNIRDIDVIFFTDDIFYQGMKEEIIRAVKQEVIKMHQDGRPMSKEYVQQNVENELHLLKQQRIKGNHLKKLRTTKTSQKKEYEETIEYLESL